MMGRAIFVLFLLLNTQTVLAQDVKSRIREPLPAAGQPQTVLLRMFGRTQIITYTKIGDDAIFGGDMRLGTHAEVQLRSLANLQMLLGGVDTTVLGDKALADRIDDLKTILQNEGRVKAAKEQDTRLWSRRRIPYKIEANIADQGMRSKILKAIEHWNTRTILKIEPAAETDREILRFKHAEVSGWKCQADLGLQTGGSFVSLTEECPLGTIVHEIGHAVGLTHEHQRPDRQQFLKVDKWAEDHPHYGTVPIDFSTSYDLCSIMHYSTDQVPKNAPDNSWFKLTPAGEALHATCRGSFPDACREVGQRCQLSAMDQIAVGQIYSRVEP